MTQRFRSRPRYDTRQFRSSCTNGEQTSFDMEFEVSNDFLYLASGNSGRNNQGKLVLTPQNLFQMSVSSFDPIGSLEITSNGIDGTCHATYPFQARSYSRLRNGAGPPLVSDDPTYFATQSKLYSRIANYKVDMSVIIGERRELVNMVSTNSRRLADFYLSLRRGRNPFRGFSRCDPRRASKLWLEHTYAWTPLVSDVYALAQLKDHEPPPYKVWARTFQHEVVGRTNEDSEGSPIGASAHVSVTDTYTRRLSTSAEAYIKIPVSALKFAQEIGLTNPLNTAWELVPYSFVVDWFLPIGNWLQNQQALYGVVVEKASVTRSSSSVVNTSVNFSNSHYDSSTTASGGINSVYKYKTKERSLGIIGYPPLKFKNPLSVSHALSGIALLVSAFSK